MDQKVLKKLRSFVKMTQNGGLIFAKLRFLGHHTSDEIKRTRTEKNDANPNKKEANWDKKDANWAQRSIKERIKF